MNDHKPEPVDPTGDRSTCERCGRVVITVTIYRGNGTRWHPFIIKTHWRHLSR